MSKFWLAVFVLLLILLGGGLVYLMNWDIPAPSHKVEKTLPDDMFPH